MLIVMNALKKIKKYIILLKKIFEYSLMNDMEYRFNFIFRATIELSYLCVTIILFEVIYSNIQQIAGWSKGEMLMLVVMTALMDSLITMIFHANMADIPRLINTGEMDFILLKPINIRFYLSIRKMILSQLINVIIDSVLLGYIVQNLGIEITFKEIAIFFALLLNGVFIMYCIFFLIMSMSFWIIKVDVGVNIFYQLFYIGNKPMDIFPNILKKIFVFVIPIFIAFSFPIQFLTKRIDDLTIAYAFGISLILFFITNIIFKRGLARYGSASS